VCRGWRPAARNCSHWRDGTQLPDGAERGLGLVGALLSIAEFGYGFGERGEPDDQQ
jgi:hypothetical protein